MVNISFLLVNYNMRGLVEQCVQSIDSQFKAMEGVTYEVLIADNSTQPEFAFTKDEANRSSLKKIFHIENKGWVHALNHLFRKVNGELVCICHPDIEFRDNCMATLVDFLKENPSVGIVSPNMTYPDGSPNKIRLRFPTLRTESKRLLNTITHILLKKKFLQDEILWDREADVEADMVMSVCMVVRRKIVEEIKAIPEAFYMYFANDYICLLARRGGYKSFYVKSVRVIHYERFADKNLYSSAKQLDYKKTAVPIADRMERDKFLFLKVLCKWPVYFLFQILSTMEFFIHALASIKQTGKCPNPIMKKYFDTIKAIWRV